MSAVALKQKLVALPDSSLETLTFGDLQVGDKFIILHAVNHDTDHVGFKEVHPVFTKTFASVSEFRGIPHKEPHGRAMFKMRTRFTDIPHTTPIICVN